MQKKSKISADDVSAVMAQELREKYRCCTNKILDWGEVLEQQENHYSDPQKFGREIYISNFN
ncbi:MAG: hypothetical protein WC554_15605 [Clostridia bacterium]